MHITMPVTGKRLSVSPISSRAFVGPKNYT